MPSQPPFVLPPGSWRERLAGLLAGAGRQGAAAAVVALLALAGVGVLWVRGAARPTGPPAALPGPAAPAGGGAAAGPGGVPLPSVAPGGTGAQGPAGGVVTVDVVGRVRRSGVVRPPAGSRVLDAVQAAGGTTAGADLDALNLARKVVDGEEEARQHDRAA